LVAKIPGSTSGVKLWGSERVRSWKRHGSLVGDVLGGIAGGAVALPQSMGLGIILFTSAGLDASAGAMAGLLGATVLSLSSGLIGATPGMISAPNGPVTMLLVASLSTLMASGVQGTGLLLSLSIILLLGGLLQLLFAFTGGGQLVKYIPFPAIAGLVTGIGILMVLSQIQSLTPGASDSVSVPWKGIPILTALITLAGIKLTQKYLSRVPGVIGGLVVGVIAFHLLVLAIPDIVPAAWMVGTIPTLHRIGAMPEVTVLAALPWMHILVTALAVAMLASVDCLLTAVVADSRTGERHDARRELVAQGMAQILIGLLGGLGGGGTKGSTLVAIDTGGRRWPSMVAGLVFLSLLLFLGPAGQVVPVSALAGIIIYVGIGMIDVNILSWMQQRRLRMDAMVAVAVIVTTVVYGLLTGLVVGVVGSVFLFIRGQLLLPVLHERASGRERRSLKERSEEERLLLDENGDRIVYVELRGNLFFGTADRLFTELMTDLEKPVWMVFNMRRVQHIDTSAMYLLRQMAARLRRNGGTMVYANVFKHSSGTRKINKAFRQLGRAVDLPKVKTFGSTDAALEYAENRLLRSLGWESRDAGKRVELAANNLCAGLDTSKIEALSAALRPLSLERKTVVYTQGEHGDTVYLVLKGEVETRLPTGRYHYKRISKIGPGGYFGSVAFLLPGPRSTSAIVTRKADLLALDRDGLDKLANSGESKAARQIFGSIAGTVTGQLRWARSELARIESG
jgi:SulP family sulfate permease